MIKEKEARVDSLYKKAMEGNKTAQLKLAKCFYYAKRVHHSLPLAKYWAFKAVESSNKASVDFYDIVNAPHFTGNERFVSIGKRGNISLMRGTFGSNKFRGKYDICPENTNMYRTYLVMRLFFIYIVLGAYRVYEPQNGSYHIIGRERMAIKEYWKWLAIDVIIIGFIVLLCVL